MSGQQTEKGTHPPGGATSESSPTRPSPLPPRQPSAAASTEGDSSSGPISPKKIDLTGRAIGGYRVLRMLGAGGMGAVCLAHQVSLDRPVALKILPQKMAKNPDFLARFTREALSAAQMTHHNIIQIYDIGNDQDIHYIAMEFVQGQNLSEIVRGEGPLEAKSAAGYILQAARGLHYAHRRGIIHRDIKPDNLMLNEQGIVKIADMGLAKIQNEAKTGTRPPADAGERASLLQRARGDLTMSEVAMGTPAYMPPEQARDASAVDHRADQYSLGCTLYFLIAGKAPFSGTTAYELICKHMSDPLPPLQERAPGCPLDLAGIVNRMMAKEAGDRYANMAEVIKELESFLGVETARGAYTPRDIHVKTLEEAQAEYYRAKSVAKRKAAIIGFYTVLPAIALFLFATGDADPFGLAIICALILTPAVKFISEGIAEKTFLFRRLKSVALGMTMKGWMATLAVALMAIVIFRLGLLIGAGIAVIAALGYNLAIKRPILRERRGPIERVQAMLKELRIRGVAEEAMKDFVAKFGGRDWEEFFEDLFGYQAMLAAREKWGIGEGGKPRKQASGWRDPLARWLDGVEEKRRTSRERKQLMDAEAARLKAEGVGETDARRQADEAASMIMREGLLHTPTPTMITPDPYNYGADPRASMAPAHAEGHDRRIRVRHGRSGPLFRVDQWIRLGAGLGLCALYAATGVLGIPLVPDALRLQHFDTPLGLAAGLMLLVSAFSSQSTLSSLILVGSVLMIANQPIAGAVGSDSFTPMYCMGVGIILILGGFAVPILRRMTGERY